MHSGKMHILPSFSLKLLHTSANKRVHKAAICPHCLKKQCHISLIFYFFTVLLFYEFLVDSV